ncbi:hypothetical protein GCM10023169_35600 [Georgenia halophila]|uniref:Blue (type 1) copper domain-containing protein n=1 Tax=Georgenia halophila TaxID=620889 RepID=A0ABP8LK52_9MICO
MEQQDTVRVRREDTVRTWREDIVRKWRATLAAALLVGAVAACGSPDESGPPSSGTSAPPATEGSADGQQSGAHENDGREDDAQQDDGQEDGGPTEVRVGLMEWGIEIAADELAAGETTLVVTNAGATGHDVAVEGAAGSWRTPVLGPGEQATLTITAVAGEQLQLICTVPGHAEQGMRTELAVADS